VSARTLSFFALGALWLLACQGESVGPTTSEYETERERLARRTQRQAAPTKAGATAAGSTASAAFGGLEEDFHYDASKRRDPFRSFVLDLKRLEESADRGPLEQFELNQLNVVAVVWDATRPRALIQDPSGASYIVQEGSKVGKNEGQIIRIDDSAVLVKEVYVDYLGERTPKDIELRIRHD